MTVSASNTTSLSHSDERILNSVFDPENSPDTPTVKIDENLPSDPHITDPTLLKQLLNRELEAIRLVEQFSISSTSRPHSLLLDLRTQMSASPDSKDEKKHEAYLQSLEILSILIEHQPEYASAYNNRAQLRRWRYGENLLKAEDANTTQALNAVLEDLETAINLASPTGPNSSVSTAQSKLLSQAWTQRGAVLWALSKRSATHELPPQRHDNSMSQGSSNTQSTAGWRTWDAVHLEEEGSRSFFMAGMYGSEIGRTMAVKTNPYARLCAGIVKEAMKSEFSIS